MLLRWISQRKATTTADKVGGWMNERTKISNLNKPIMHAQRRIYSLINSFLHELN